MAPTSGLCHVEDHRFAREEMPSCLELLQLFTDRLAHTEWPGFPFNLACRLNSGKQPGSHSFIQSHRQTWVPVPSPGAVPPLLSQVPFTLSSVPSVCFWGAPCLLLSRLCLAQVYPGLRTVPQECLCCQCYAKFGGHLPVPRADALLPYWVPLSLRPRKQVSE